MSLKDRRKTQLVDQFRMIAKGAVPFVILIVIWHYLTSQEIIPVYVLPTPISVIEKARKLILNGSLFIHIRDSLIRVLIGCIAGMGIGLPLGIAIGLNRYVASFFEPILNFFQAVAGIAWVPLAVIWFGFGLGSVAFVVGNTVMFLVLFNTVLGVEQVPIVLRRAVRTLGASRWDVITQVIVPGALPSIVIGVRMGMSFGWRALIAAEIIASSTGLGLMIWDASRFFAADEVILGIIVIGIVWLLLDRLILKTIEMRTTERWGTY